MMINTYGMTVGSTISIDVQLSKIGISCLTEAGGSMSSTGEATIICNKEYNKKKAIYIFTKGDIACKDHAVIPVDKDDHVIYVERHNNTCSVYDFKVIDIIRKKAVLLLTNNKVVGTDYNGNSAIEAAIRKSLDYHCKQPYYITNNCLK